MIAVNSIVKKCMTFSNAHLLGIHFLGDLVTLLRMHDKMMFCFVACISFFWRHKHALWLSSLFLSWQLLPTAHHHAGLQVIVCGLWVFHKSPYPLLHLNINLCSFSSNIYPLYLDLGLLFLINDSLHIDVNGATHDTRWRLCLLAQNDGTDIAYLDPSVIIG